MYEYFICLKFEDRKQPARISNPGPPLSSAAKLTVEIGQEANQLCLALFE